MPALQYVTLPTHLALSAIGVEPPKRALWQFGAPGQSQTVWGEEEQRND